MDIEDGGPINGGGAMLLLLLGGPIIDGGAMLFGGPIIVLLFCAAATDGGVGAGYLLPKLDIGPPDKGGALGPGGGAAVGGPP